MVRRRKSQNFSPKNVELYKKSTNGYNLRQIVSKNTPLNNKYKEWERTLKKIAKRSFTKVTKNKYTGISKKLKRIMHERRKHIKDKGDNETIRTLNEEIEETMQKEHADEGQKIAERITKEGGVNNPGFWKVLKQKKSENDRAVAMKTKQGVMQTGKEEIKEVYKQHYKELLQTIPADDDEGKQAEKEVDRNFNLLRKTSKNAETKEITAKEIEIALKKLKSKKAADEGGVRAEYFMYGGEDLKISLLNILNEILKEGTIPEKWKKMRIKSIYKNKGSRNEMKNQRGIFITNVVSKIFERVLLNRNRELIESSMSPFQCGGRKKRGIADHLFTLKRMIESYKEKRKVLYVFYGDLEKCFDKLWLKDSIIELWKTGMNPKEIMLVYNMNKTCLITIDTPLGKTEEIEVKEIVRQGTIWGPTLCSITTDKVNNVAERVFSKYEEAEVEPMVYVDDICATGDEENIISAVKNCHRLEKTKKMTFNNEKSNYQAIGGTKKNKKMIQLKVKKGNIKRCEKYKYLGEVINEKGDLEDTIRKKGSKARGITLAIQKLSNKAGYFRNSVAEKLIKTTLLPVLTYGTETWS
eukprot:TCONS_00045769-protein